MPSLKISEDELGRFLLAYNRKVFHPRAKLGACFLFYYNVPGHDDIRLEENDSRALSKIQDRFTGVLG